MKKYYGFANKIEFWICFLLCPLFAISMEQMDKDKQVEPW